MTAPDTAMTDGSNYDPIALTESFASAADKGAKLLGDFLSRQAIGGPSMAADEFGLSKAFLEVAAKILSNPYRLAETQMNLWWDYSALWQSSMLKLMGQSAAPVAEPAKTDKRFRHEDWQEHFLFDYVKQSYLLTARWLHDAVANVEGLDERTRKRSTSLPANTSMRSRRPILRSPIPRCSARPSPPAGRTWSRGSTTFSTTSSAAMASSKSR